MGWINFISEIEESSRLQLKKQIRKKNKFLCELQNLPSWDSPDVFLDDDEEDVEERMNHRTEDVLDIFDSVKHIFDQDNVNQDEIVKISETEETVVSNLTKRQNLTKRFRHSFRKKMSQLKIRHKDSENPHENKSFKNVIHRIFKKFYLQKKI